MDEEQREKENSDPEDTSGKELKEYTRKFFKGFRAMLQKQGYPTEENRATVSSSAITPCEKAKVNTELFEEKDKQKPLFNNYDDIIQKTLKEEIKGRTLLTLLPDSEKLRVHRKIALKAPFSTSVGKHITFGCHLRRGNADLGSSPIYEYAKIILNVIDISEEPLGLFTQLFSRQPLDTPLQLPDQDRFYLVGLVCVIKREKLEELCSRRKEDLEESEDEDFVDYSFRRVKQSKNTPETEALNVDLDISPMTEPFAVSPVQQYGSPHSFGDYNLESDSSDDSDSSSPGASASWNALSCFQNYSFNLDHKVQRVSKSKSLLEQFKYRMAELEKKQAVDKLMPLIEVKKGEKTEENRVLEDKTIKDEYQVEEESVKKAEEAEAVQEKPTEEEVKLEVVKKAQEVDSVETLELVVKVEPAENVSAGQVNLEEKVDSTEETEIIDVKMKELVEVTKEAEEAEQVEEKLDDPKESKFTQEAAEGDPETFFSVAATGSAQSSPVTAPIVIINRALEDTTELRHIDTTHSEETLEETMEPLETMQEPALGSQICISVPCHSSASQTPATLTKSPQKRKQSYSDSCKAKLFCVSSVTHTIISEELGEPCITSTQQVQLPTTGVQDSPSPDATQNPADNPADGEEMPSSKDKKHLWMDP